MNFPQYQVERLEDTKYLTKIANKYNIFYTIHLDENLNVCDFKCEVAKAYMQTVKRCTEVAKKIHASVINMHMNHGIYITLPDRKVQLYEKYKNEYINSFLQFKNMCEKLIGDSDIKVCIENTDGFRSYEKDAINELLKSKVFRLTWDIGHSHTTKNVDEKFIMENKQFLNHFHIHDGLDKNNHLELGTGEIDLTQSLGIAKECGCRCVVETKTVEALKNSVVWLKENGCFQK